MIRFIKTIILSITVAALAILVEQAAAIFAEMFWKKEIILQFYSNFSSFLFFAIVIEESFKFLAIFYVIQKNFLAKGKKLALLAFLLGLVWGIFESGLVLYTQPNLISLLKSANSEIIISLSGVVLIHALTACLMGILIASSGSQKISGNTKALFIPILVHILYNFLIIQKGDYTNYLLIISFFVVFFTGLTVFFLNLKKFA